VTVMAVWILTAIIRVQELPTHAAVQYIDVFATAAACERERARMEAADKEAIWACTQEVPRL